MADNRNLRADVQPVSEPRYGAIDGAMAGRKPGGCMSEPRPSPRMVASTKGARVALHDLGGNGPPVLLTHANGFCGRVWEPVADALGSVARCWALDFRGHGDSQSGPDEGYAWSGMADDVLAVVDALDLVPRVAAGHSLGGAAILKAEQARPGTFRRAWVFEPVMMPPTIEPPGSGNVLAASARKRQPEFESRQAAYERYASRPPFNQVAAEALRAYVDHGFRDQPDGSVTLKCRPETEAMIFESPDFDGFPQLGEVAAEVTVVVGNDTGPPAMVAPQVAAMLPQGTLERHDDLTHFGPLQDPARIAASIAASLLTD